MADKNDRTQNQNWFFNIARDAGEKFRRYISDRSMRS